MYISYNGPVLCDCAWLKIFFFNAAVMAVMWVALAVLWIGGSYIGMPPPLTCSSPISSCYILLQRSRSLSYTCTAKDAKIPGAASCVGKANVSIGTGGNSFIWWASVSPRIRFGGRKALIHPLPFS